MSSSSSMSLLEFGIISLLNFSHCRGCKMELHCGLSFHFSADWRCWASFHMLIDHVYLLSVFSRILTIFYWIISVLLIICRNSLCILNTVYTLSFNFLNSAFWWELFTFDEVQFIKFYFMFSVFGVLSKKSL